MPKKIFTLCFVVFNLLQISPTFAHGELVDSYPVQFANVNPIPLQVWLQFDGDLQIIDGETINTIEVEDSTGIVVSYGDAIIEGGKITTKLSGQSAPGVFTVRYRIVSQDGHPVEGSYTFNASPDYSKVKPSPIQPAENGSNLLVNGATLAALLVVLVLAISRGRKKDS